MIWARDRPAGLGQEAAQQALVGPPPQGVVKPPHGFRHERVGVGAGLWLQVDLLASVEEFPNLIQGLQPVRVESHDHPPMILDPAPVQAHVSLETTPRSGSCVIGRDYVDDPAVSYPVPSPSIGMLASL